LTSVGRFAPLDLLILHVVPDQITRSGTGYTADRSTGTRRSNGGPYQRAAASTDCATRQRTFFTRT
jgi:hypothetical protein